MKVRKYDRYGAIYKAEANEFKSDFKLNRINRAPGSISTFSKSVLSDVDLCDCCL